MTNAVISGGIFKLVNYFIEPEYIPAAVVFPFPLHVLFLFMHILNIVKLRRDWVQHQETSAQVSVLPITVHGTFDRGPPTTLDLRVFIFEM